MNTPRWQYHLGHHAIDHCGSEDRLGGISSTLFTVFPDTNSALATGAVFQTQCSGVQDNHVTIVPDGLHAAEDRLGAMKRRVALNSDCMRRIPTGCGPRLTRSDSNFSMQIQRWR